MAVTMSFGWNPWHGCEKISAGCANCYVYRMDTRHGRDPRSVCKTGEFDLPVRKNRNGEYKIAPGTLVFTRFTSDFLLDKADDWRDDAWRCIKERSDLNFLFVTKRIDRLEKCVPDDWGQGYTNVEICCTVENQDRADYRLPIFLAAPIARKSIICEPLLERIDIGEYLCEEIRQVVVGGESGDGARPCDFEWVKDIRRQCVEKNVSFHFKQTGANFIKEGRQYRIERRFQHTQARKAGIEFAAKKPKNFYKSGIDMWN